jgi:transcriptional regulator GlxA family with amidase domain
MRHSGKTPTRPARLGPAKDREGAAVVEMLDGATSSEGEAVTELRVGILLWPKFPLLSLAGLCDAMRHAADVGDQSRQVRCSWSVLGVPGRPVQASCGVEIPVQDSLATDQSFDYIAVIGGLLPSIGEADRRYVEFVQRAHDAGTPILGICTGTFVLAKFGLMDNKRACIHPFHVQDWLRLHPGLPYSTDCDYVFDGNRITCAGGISIIELAAELVRIHCGADRAAKVVHQMTVSHRSTQSHVARRHALGYASSESEHIRQAVMLMEKNLATPLEVGVIAKLVGSNPKQLERIFLKELGQSPSEFYRNSRLKYARWLVTTTDLPISAIAFESGFSDAPDLIRLFQNLYGTAPGKLRRALNEAGRIANERAAEAVSRDRSKA